MLEDLPQEVKDGLKAARDRAQRRKGRMRVDVGGQTFTVLRYWDEGFSLRAEDAPRMRGHVDLYDGPRHMGRCLIVASGADDDEMVYEFKRMTPVSDRPPVDFARGDFTPAALLPIFH
ncbi:hypothetical protein [Oceaniglobus trochenteri]|uniref:hypothetical protein n=1 Tax=Oceaniglobus trochenteri TaxID=2763260 RepID=UPI001D000B2A|nr:hypothetical protein [Oceaniglobus trochenteri]